MGATTTMPGRRVNGPRRDTESLGGPMLNNPTCLLCPRPRKHGRYCNRCYSSVQGTLTREPAEMFWAKVDKDGPIPDFRPDLGPCWLWTGSVSQGYGHLTRDAISLAAHAYGCKLQGGDCPPNLDHDHLCRVRRCVRRSHLEHVTRKENAQRGARGRLVTHCPRGHAYDEANTYVTKQGRRDCRACHRMESHKYEPGRDESHGMEMQT